MAVDKAVLDALADELEVIASWHTGPKYQRVITLVDKLRSADVTPESVAAYSIADAATPGAAPAEQPVEQPAE